MNLALRYQIAYDSRSICLAGVVKRVLGAVVGRLYRISALSAAHDLGELFYYATRLDRAALRPRVLESA